MASLIAFIAVMIDVRTWVDMVPWKSSGLSASAMSAGFAAIASRFAMSIEVPRGRSGLKAVGVVFAETPL